MITMNILDFVAQLGQLGDLRVVDRADTIHVHFATAVNTEALDDLVCDALFVDPIGREQDDQGCTLELAKRNKPRHTSDMRVVGSGTSVRYEC
jgi:hypothetical protein